MTQPSPIEARQAAQLAQALERGAEGKWEAIDPDVMEAVFALRPELAPAPRAGLLNEVFDDLLDGPLALEPSAEELAEAAALADALATGELPRLADNDLNEAIVALSPDRAPAPSLSIDDILDSVSTGPFAPVIRITGEFPAEIAPPTQLSTEADSADAPDPIEAPAEVVSLASRRAAAPSPTRRWWFPAVGVLAAAAGVLLFIGPTFDTNQSMPVLEGAKMAEEPATATAAQAPTALEPARPKRMATESDRDGDIDAKDDVARSQDRDARPAARPAPAKKTAAPSASSGTSTTRQSAPTTPTLDDALSASGYVEAEPAPAAGAGPAREASRGAASTRSAGGETADKTAELQDYRNTGDDDWSVAGADYGGATNTGEFGQPTNTATPAPAPPAEPVEEAELEEGVALGYAADEFDDLAAVERREDANAPADAPAAAYADYDDADEGVSIAVESKSRKRKERAPRKGGAKAEAAPMQPAADMEAPVEHSAQDLGLLEPALAAQRPDLHDIWASAQSLLQQGNYVDSARLLIRLASVDPSHDVAVDAAVRAGRAWLAVGDVDSAMAALALAEQRTPSQASLIHAREGLRERVYPRKATDRTMSDPG